MLFTPKISGGCRAFLITKTRSEAFRPIFFHGTKFLSSLKTNISGFLWKTQHPYTYNIVGLKPLTPGFYCVQVFQRVFCRVLCVFHRILILNSEFLTQPYQTYVISDSTSVFTHHHIHLVNLAIFKDGQKLPFKGFTIHHDRFDTFTNSFRVADFDLIGRSPELSSY